MDKGIWIAIIVMIVAAVGFFLLQALPQTNQPPTEVNSNSNATQTSQQTDQAPAAITDQASCQAAAQYAAQNDNASLGGSNFNSSSQCYYELDTFSASGNITSINLAPNDATVASCATASDGSLSCEENGASISEPQFKSLLSTYLPNL